MIRLSKCSVGDAEKAAVSAVLDRAFLGMGAEVAKFEDQLATYFGRPALCVTNGTAALQLALQACGIGQNDEVLVQSLTYVASFQAITATGATPVACDVELPTLTLDWRDAESRITDKTRAIMPVHYSGGVGSLREIYALAKDRGLRVIEDAAHALGSTFDERRVGSFGDISCFSFDGIKNITSGEGGCVVTDDQNVLQQIQNARLLGVVGDSERRKRGERTWDPEVTGQGWRYHMSDIMAAIGNAQLPRLADFAQKRQKLAARYMDQLANTPEVEPIRNDLSAIVPHIFPVRLLPPASRDTIRAKLADRGIQTGVHYYPNHRLEFFRSGGSANLPVTDTVAGQLLSLPLHADLSEDEVDFVCKSLVQVLSSQ